MSTPKSPPPKGMLYEILLFCEKNNLYVGDWNGDPVQGNIEDYIPHGISLYVEAADSDGKWKSFTLSPVFRTLQDAIRWIQGNRSRLIKLGATWQYERQRSVDNLVHACMPSHDPNCRSVIARTSTTLVECEHGYDVCPKCDSCDCSANRLIPSDSP